MSIELELREASWLRARRFADRRRILHPQTRARALLACADTLIRRTRDGWSPELPNGWGDREALGERLLGATDDPLPEQSTAEWRARFLAAITVVESIGWGRGAYDFDLGVAYPIKAVTGLDDPRLVMIAKASALAGLTDAELDAAACKFARLERAAMTICESWMEKLPKPAPPPSRPSFPRTPAKPAPARANYDDSKLCEILAEMPDEPSVSDRLDLCQRLLADTCPPAPETREGPDAPKVRPEAQLVAAAQLADHLQRLLERGAAEKARRLARDFPRGDGCEPEYLARAADLDTELVQPVREALSSVRGMMVTAAIRARYIKRWPGSREQPKHARARALADQFRETVTPAEVEQAFASLGQTRIEAPV